MGKGVPRSRRDDLGTRSGEYDGEVAANGLTNPNILRMAGLLGLKSIPPMSITVEGIESLLRKNGPLWTNGKTHIVVIGGADPMHDRVLVPDSREASLRDYCGAPSPLSRRSWRRALSRSASAWMRPASAAKASRSAWISSSCVPTPER